MDASEERPTAYGRKVGERLRTIRRQKRLSLQDVEAGSGEEFRASVLGAYERGERAISVPRLQRLAAFYAVPVDQLLPNGDTIDLSAAGRNGVADRRANQPVTLDLTRLRQVPTPEARQLERFVEMIQVQRQDFNGRMLTIRRDDLRAVACILDTTVDRLRDLLHGAGLALSR